MVGTLGGSAQSSQGSGIQSSQGAQRSEGTHLRGKTFESVGVFSGLKFYRVTCSCGWKGFDENDRGIAVESFKRHVRQQEAA